MKIAFTGVKNLHGELAEYIGQDLVKNRKN